MGALKSKQSPLFQKLMSRSRPYEESVDDYSCRIVEFIKRNQNKQIFANCDEAIKWKVFNCKREVYKHWFIVFQPSEIPDADHLAIELNVNDANNVVIMNFGLLIPGGPMCQALEDLGEINVSVALIFGTAYDVMKDMGVYNVLYNNCQDFVKTLASNLQAPEEVTPVVQSEYMHVHTITYSSCNMISLHKPAVYTVLICVYKH